MNDEERSMLQHQVNTALLNLGFVIKQYGIYEHGKYFVKVDSEKLKEFATKAMQHKIRLSTQTTDEDGNIYYEIEEIK